jgi:hypothetical protein
MKRLWILWCEEATFRVGGAKAKTFFRTNNRKGEVSTRELSSAVPTHGFLP